MTDTAPAAAADAGANAPAAGAAPAAAADAKIPAGADGAAKPDAKPAAADPKAAFEKAWAEFKPPEGLDKDMLKDVVEFARANGVDPKAAAALALREKARAEKEEAEFKHMSEKGWLEDLQKDPELGGEKVRETMVTVMRAADRLNPKTQALIKEAGGVYNPVVVRILHDIGSKLKEDAFVRPGASPAQEQKLTPEQRLEAQYRAYGK